MAEFNPDLERSEREAADWFTRLGSKVIPTKAIEEFYAWRRDPLNAASYRRVEEVWSKTSRLQGDPEIDIAVHEALKRGAERRKAGLLADLAGRKVVVSAILAIAIAVAGAYLVLRPQGYSTAVGEQRTVRLTDGTRVTLDTDSSLSVRLNKERREIRLIRGQALFDVARDPARPFVVATDKGQIRALGTRFEVELRAADMKVTLLEGVVEVRPQSTAGGETWTLAPGQQVTLSKTMGSPAAPRSVDVAADTSWTTGRLIFRQTPLAEAVSEVNRYSRDKIELRAGALSTKPVNGAFETGDSEAFAGAIATLFDLEVARSAGGKIVLQTRELGTDR